MNDEIEVKRPVGRPRKNLPPKAQPKAESKVEPKVRWQMTEKANWDETDDSPLDSDRLHIPADQIPEGMALQWVTSTVTGMNFEHHRSMFTRRGWTPVHQADFDGRFNGRFMPKGAKGEITVEGLVLMARPREMNIKSRHQDIQDANQQLIEHEKKLMNGTATQVTMGTDSATHRSAVHFNHIKKMYERADIPEDK